MKLSVILAGLAVVISATSASLFDIRNRKCNDVVITGENQIPEILKKGVDAPYQLAIDYDTNYLFFSYTQKDGNFVSSYIDLNTNEFESVRGIRGGFANTYDPYTRTLYIGGADGIYEFDYETKSGIRTNITDKNIWQVFAKASVYFTTFPDKKAFVYRNGEVNQVPGIGDTNVTLIGVDTEDNIFYSNSSGLFMLNVSGTTIFVGDFQVIAFTIDFNGELYFATPSGFYVIKQPQRIVQLVRIVGIYGMVVASEDSIIYSDSSSIVRLQPDGSECIPELSILEHP